MDNREIKPCAACGGGLAGGSGSPLVGMRLTTQRLMINQGNLNAHLGLEQHFAQAGPAGQRAMADILGPGTVIDEPPELRTEIIICESCAIPVMIVLEQAGERQAALDG